MRRLFDTVKSSRTCSVATVSLRLAVLSHFWSQNGPFSKHFGIFRGPKRATTGSKRANNTCLSIPSGLGTTLKTIIFFAPGTPVDPPLAPSVRGLAGPPAAPSDHWYKGLGVSLGNSKAWKP